MAKPRLRGHAYRKAREVMFAKYGDVCHICGHPGARQADHIVPLSDDPTQIITADAMRPAHGGGRIDNPCPTCGRRCNQERGNSPVEVARLGNQSRPSRIW